MSLEHELSAIVQGSGLFCPRIKLAADFVLAGVPECSAGIDLHEGVETEIFEGGEIFFARVSNFQSAAAGLLGEAHGEAREHAHEGGIHA